MAIDFLKKNPDSMAVAKSFYGCSRKLSGLRQVLGDANPVLIYIYDAVGKIMAPKSRKKRKQKSGNNKRDKKVKKGNPANNLTGSVVETTIGSCLEGERNGKINREIGDVYCV